MSRRRRGTAAYGQWVWAVFGKTIDDPHDRVKMIPIDRRKTQKWQEGKGGFEIDENEEGEGRADGSPGPVGKTAWYNEQVPPLALWIAGSDKLVDGWKLLRRLQNGREPNVKLVHAKVIPEYEHLDVIWAMDVIEKVGSEVRDVLWKTIPEGLKEGVDRVDGNE